MMVTGHRGIYYIIHDNCKNCTEGKIIVEVPKRVLEPGGEKRERKKGKGGKKKKGKKKGKRGKIKNKRWWWW